MSLAPTYTGYIGSTRDAVLVIQGVLSKEFTVVHRRPHSRERADLIKSGNVFVFIEESSGIKRWTDGIAWSPSRILGRFLVYRELDKSLHGDEKRRRKRNSEPSVSSRSSASDSSDRQSSISDQTYTYQQQHFNPQLPMVNQQLTSPLQYSKDVSAPRFAKEDHGLIKKTLSVTTTVKDSDSKEEKQTVHLISYYSAYDVLSGRLTRPSQSNLQYMPVAPNLWEAIQKSSLGGKIPIEDEAHYFLDSNYQLQNMSVLMTGKPEPRKQMGASPRLQAPNGSKRQLFQQPYSQPLSVNYASPYPVNKVSSVLPSHYHQEMPQYGRLGHPVKGEKKDDENYDLHLSANPNHPITGHFPDPTEKQQPVQPPQAHAHSSIHAQQHPSVPPIQMPQPDQQPPFQQSDQGQGQGQGMYFGGYSHQMPYQYYNTGPGLLNPAASGDQYSLGNPPGPPTNTGQPLPPYQAPFYNSGYSYTVPPMQQQPSEARHVPSARIRPEVSEIYQPVDEQYSYTPWKETL
ncbi:hypothetical protein CXQ85_004729 [Candidozyma haemuli]|uniref:Gti1/Pac2 family protein n=1 Tax=Candidozyma haemuli TaxID=45357 RepID=A0A2V1AVC2_9ASCO|nr:hypothetical protein CXQ85_004729 [[Candida] haemuloni]PVH22060.1 hypothetical protein CXQ85_004729 [[Candida] haemuloni]